MKKIILSITTAVCVAAAAPAFAQTAPAPGNHIINDLQIGDKAPSTEVTMKNATNGKSTKLATEFTSKGLLVMFSCNTCPYVIKSQLRTKEIMKYATENGVGMVIINSNETQRKGGESYAAMKKYAQEQGYIVPYLMDDGQAMADMFGATHTPEVYLFDANKQLVYRGAMEDNPTEPARSKFMYAHDAIANMLAHKPINPSRTRSMGCGIKRS